MVRAHDAAGIERLFNEIDRRVAATDVGPAALGRMHRVRAVVQMHSGDLSAALANQRRALELFRQAGDVRNAAQQMCTIGSTHSSLGDYQQSAQLIREALPDAERVGLSRAIWWARGMLAEVLMHLGQIDASRAAQLAVLEVAKARGERRLTAAATNSMSYVEWLAGNFTLAERYARAVSDNPDTPTSFRATSRALLSRSLLSQGRVDESLRAAEDATEVLRGLGAHNDDEGLTCLAHAEALEAAGRRDEAKSVVRDAVARLRAAAAKISDPAWAQGFLEHVPHNARTLALARAWEVEG
jgi:tetratricopeptide (TPR) repeat protein